MNETEGRVGRNPRNRGVNLRGQEMVSMTFFQLVISPENWTKRLAMVSRGLQPSLRYDTLCSQVASAENRPCWKLESRIAAPRYSGRPGRKNDHSSSANLFVKNQTPPPSWMGDFQPYNIINNPQPIKCLAFLL